MDHYDLLVDIEKIKNRRLTKKKLEIEERRLDIELAVLDKKLKQSYAFIYTPICKKNVCLYVCVNMGYVYVCVLIPGCDKNMYACCCLCVCMCVIIWDMCMCVY